MLQQSAGAKISIGDTSLGGNYDPDTHVLDEEESGFSANYYVEISYIESIGSITNEFEELSIMELGTDYYEKYKGSFNSNTLDINLAYNPTNDGQDFIKSALRGSKKNHDWPFRIVLNNNSTFYFAGKVLSFNTNIGSGNSIVNSNIVITINPISIREPDFHPANWWQYFFSEAV